MRNTSQSLRKARDAAPRLPRSDLTDWSRPNRWARAGPEPSTGKRPGSARGKVVVSGMRWGKADAGCCPTERIEVTFSIARAAGGETRYPLLVQSEAAVR